MEEQKKRVKCPFLNGADCLQEECGIFTDECAIKELSKYISIFCDFVWSESLQE